MNYEKNLKYYKSNDKHFYVGVIILGIGVLLFALSTLFRLRFIPSQMSVSMTIGIIGAAIAFIPSSMRSSEKDIEEAILRATDKYDQAVAESVNITLSRRMKPALLGQFVYDGDVLLRRGRTDRKYRSSKYTASALLFTEDGVYISQKTFSFIEESTVETDMEFVFESIDEAYAVCEERVFGESDKVKLHFLVIEENGKEAARIPVKYNAVVDRVCDDINNAIAEAKGLKKR